MSFATVQAAVPTYHLPVVSPDVTGRRALRRAVGDALDRGARRIVVDCASWKPQDLVLISHLIGCAGLCAAEGAEFELENLDSTVRDTLNELRLSSRLGLCLEQ